MLVMAKFLAATDCKLEKIKEFKFTDLLKNYTLEDIRTQFQRIDCIHLYHFIEYYKLKYGYKDPKLNQLSNLCKSSIKTTIAECIPHESKLQEDVTNILRKSFSNVEEEISVEGFTIDIAVKNSDKILLFEVNGPYHFESDRSAFNQKTQFKHTFLKLKGLNVYNINFQEWNQLPDDKSKEIFLNSLIRN